MTKLSPEANDLLAQFRRADRLGPRAHERMARGLFEKLARGEAALPGIDAAPPALPDLSWTAKLWGSAAAKLSTGVLIVAAGVTAVTLTTGRAPTPAVAPSQAPAAETPAPSAAVPVAPAPTPFVAPTAAAQPQPAAAPPVKRPRTRASSRPRARAAPPVQVVEQAPPPLVEPPPSAAATALPEPPPPALPEPEPKSIAPHRVTSPLDSELGLLRRAYLELNASRPARAIEALDEHAYRFPKGELVEAREVARMLALCGLDREPDARALARKFLKARPGSPFSGRVRALCPTSLPKTSP